jgi:hypothetical protein
LGVVVRDIDARRLVEQRRMDRGVGDQNRLVADPQPEMARKMPG